jgi:hypothetical protein
VALEYACVGRAVENFPLVSPPTAATKAAEAEAEAPAPRASPRRPTEADIAYFDAAAAAAADGRAPWLLAATDAAALPQWRPLLQALRTPDFQAGGGTVCLAPARDYPFTTREAAAELQIAPTGADAATLEAARGLGLSARMGVLYMTRRYAERYVQAPEGGERWEEVEADVATPAAPGFRGRRHFPRCYAGESGDAADFLAGDNSCGLKLADGDAGNYATQAPAAFTARADPAAIGMDVGQEWYMGSPLVIDAAPALMIDFPPAGEEREALLAAASRAADASCAAFNPTGGYAEAAEEFGRRCGEAFAKREALPRLWEEWEAAEKVGVAAMKKNLAARRAKEAAAKAAGGAVEAAEKAAGAGEAAPQAAAVRAEAAAAAPPAGAEEEEEKEEAAPAARAKETAAAPEAASAKEEAVARRPDAQKPAAAKKARTDK